MVSREKLHLTGPAKAPGRTGPICIGFDATSSEGNPALVTLIGGEQQIEHSKLPVRKYWTMLILACNRQLVFCSN